MDEFAECYNEIKSIGSEDGTRDPLNQILTAAFAHEDMVAEGEVLLPRTTLKEMHARLKDAEDEADSAQAQVCTSERPGVCRPSCSSEPTIHRVCGDQARGHETN